MISISTPDAMSVINAVSDSDTFTDPVTIVEGINTVSRIVTVTVSRKSSINDGLQSTIRLILLTDIFCDVQHDVNDIEIIAATTAVRPAPAPPMIPIRLPCFIDEKIGHKFTNDTDAQNNDRNRLIFGRDRVTRRHGRCCK